MTEALSKEASFSVHVFYFRIILFLNATTVTDYCNVLLKQDITSAAFQNTVCFVFHFWLLELCNILKIVF